MSYEEVFGLEWSEIDFDDALVRAFALGMVSIERELPDGELDRLNEVATSRYEQELLDTAFQEGRRFQEGSATGRSAADLPSFVDRSDLEPLVRVVDGGDDLAAGLPSALSATPVDREHSLPTSLRPSLPRLLYRRDG